MRKILLILFLLPCIAHSQESESLYLISGHPYENTDQMFESVLWKYHSHDSLTKTVEISDPSYLLKNITAYSKDRLVAAYKTNFLGDYASDNRLVVIDMDQPGAIYDIPVGHIGYGLTAIHFIKTDNEPLFGLYLFGPNKEGPRSFIGLSLSDKAIKNILIGDFKHSMLAGYPGGAIDGGDYIVAYSDEKTGFLEIPYTGNRTQRPVFPFELPIEQRFNKYERHIIPINNDDIFVVGGKRTIEDNQLGSYELKILNKETNEWHTKAIKGNLIRSRCFEKWIVGYVYNENIGHKKLPGSELWTHRESGLSPAERFNTLHPNSSYAPGILYFYNSYTKTYFELKTDQADSEVVLLWRDQIIYRKYDELYKASIIEGKRLGESELLLKGDVVPDIHWAFFSQN